MTTNTTRTQFRQEWPLIRREDGCRVEIMCPHGIGHPVKSLSRNWKDWMEVHGCDGCCNTAAFALAEIAHGEKPGVKPFTTQVCEQCGRPRIDAGTRCWCGAKWAEMLSGRDE